MSLPVPVLDDRKYQDLVDEAKRLIPKHCPEWTNHNLSDPGVALIELFAWMSEMIMFRLNQVPDAFYTRMLNLLGIETFPATAATAPVTFWTVATQDDAPIVVPAGTEIGTASDGTDSQVFATVADLVIRQSRLFAALTSSNEEFYLDVWDQLGFDRESVTCFESTPLRPDDSFYLGFDTSLAGGVIELRIRASLEGIGVDPDDPPLCWEVWGGDAWIRATVHDDTTGGLNRDGSIVLLVPELHEPVTLGRHRAYWLRARLLPARPGQATYRTSPRIRSLTTRVLGGTALAEHSDAIGEEHLGTSTGAPGQTFVVEHRPVLGRRAGETVRVVTPDGATDWIEVEDFLRSGPDDPHFVWDSTTGEVSFGPRIRYADGSTRQHGAAPPAGAQIRVTGYRHGGGAVGNVGRSTLSELRSTIPFVNRVENLAPATGGVDAESVDNAKQRGPHSLRTGQRAVTVDDFERLTLESDPAIARARCLPPADGIGPIRMLLVPSVEKDPVTLELDDFALPATMVDRVTEHLDERRILGTSIEIGTPFYQGITVAALIKALPGRPAELVRHRALETLYRYVNPVTGGADGRGWPFEADLNAANILQLIDGIDGVERVDEVLFFEYDLRNGVRHGRGHEVVKLARHSLFLSAHHQVVVR